MKLFTVDFKSMFPVPSCLIIRAENIENAKKIAHKTITHAKINDIKEIELDGEGVVIYLSGDY